MLFEFRAYVFIFSLCLIDIVSCCNIRSAQFQGSNVSGLVRDGNFRVCRVRSAELGMNGPQSPSEPIMLFPAYSRIVYIRVWESPLHFDAGGTKVPFTFIRSSFGEDLYVTNLHLPFLGTEYCSEANCTPLTSSLSPSALWPLSSLDELAPQRHFSLWLSPCRMFRAETQPPQRGPKKTKLSRPKKASVDLNLFYPHARCPRNELATHAASLPATSQSH